MIDNNVNNYETNLNNNKTSGAGRQNIAASQQKSQSIFMQDVNSKLKPLNLGMEDLNSFTSSAENIFSKYDTDGVSGWSAQEESNAVGALKQFWNRVVDFMAKKDPASNKWSSNGEIEHAEQGNRGDCWLLAQVNSLSETNFGKEAIKNAIQKNDDGSYTVKIKATGDEYTITSEEIIEARNSGNYSNGDLDMMILEMGLEKHYTKYNSSGKTDVLDGRNPNYDDEVPSEENGDLSYLLTGEKTHETSGYEEDNIAIFKLKAKYQDEISVPITLDKEVVTDEYFDPPEKEEIEGLNGEKIKFEMPTSCHEYHIRTVKLDENGDIESVTIVNPWDNTKEIEMTYDELKERGHISGISYSTDNEEVKQEINDIPNSNMTELSNNVKGSDKEISTFDEYDTFNSRMFDLVFYAKEHGKTNDVDVMELHEKFSTYHFAAQEERESASVCFMVSIAMTPEAEASLDKMDKSQMYEICNNPEKFKQWCKDNNLPIKDE